MKTVLKVAAGVLLGGGVLIAGVVGVLALTGGDPPTKTERRIAEQEAQQAEDPIESYDSLEQGEEVLGDAADEWCESEEGDELAQLGSEVVEDRPGPRTRRSPGTRGGSTRPPTGCSG